MGDYMVFEKAGQSHVEEACELAKQELQIEQKSCRYLKKKDYTDKLIPLISDLFQSEYSLVAKENDNIIGYLAFWGDIDSFFGNAKGAFSPLHGSAFGGRNRSKTGSLLFEELSKAMVKKEITSYAICKYAHDEEISKMLVFNGFGIRCSDAIRDITEGMELICKEENNNFIYYELEKNQEESLFMFKNQLIQHLHQSPVYYPTPLYSKEQFFEQCKSRRFFVVKTEGKIIGYMEVTEDGETFVSEDTDTKNICGMYIDKNYRSTGAATGLVHYVINKLKQEGVSYLGVDCETLNPNALHFWRKYFEHYSYSYVRRIDERILY